MGKNKKQNRKLGHSVKKRIWRMFSWINRQLERFSAVLHILIVIIVVCISTQAVSFCIVYMQLLNEKEISGLLFRYINIWNIIPSGDVAQIYERFEDVKVRIEFLMNVSVALSGILLSIVTFISYFKKNVDIRRTSCFRKREIFETGVDDIAIMCDYFSKANFVAIYSHSFGWLNKNEEIREVLTELSRKNKLRLYTGDDDEQAVKARLTECSQELLECIKKTDISLRFSYIERNNAKYLLYRQEEEEHTYVIIVHENKESQYLLQAISQLVK